MKVPKIVSFLILLNGVNFISYVDGCSGRMMINGNGITEYDKQIIMDMHNKMRQSVALGHIYGQPSAANIQELKWDDELALKAQKWATSCQSEHHDEGRHVSRFPVGQNIATTWTNRRPSSLYDIVPDFADAISKWFNEVRNYRYGKINYNGDLTGHYTQIVWADTNLIGCGFAFYYDRFKGYTKNYICNYGPGGNIITYTPYMKGVSSCANFDLQVSNKYKGLCEKKSRYMYDVISNYLG